MNYITIELLSIFTNSNRFYSFQLRIDFLALSLAQPNGEGVCVNDALTIEGGASPLPIICGENSGQHVYVSYNGLTPITISITLGDEPVFDRKWTIRIAQIACSCPTLGKIFFKFHV